MRALDAGRECLPDVEPVLWHLHPSAEGQTSLTAIPVSAFIEVLREGKRFPRVSQRSPYSHVQHAKVRCIPTLLGTQRTSPQRTLCPTLLVTLKSARCTGGAFRRVADVRRVRDGGRGRARPPWSRQLSRRRRASNSPPAIIAKRGSSDGSGTATSAKAKLIFTTEVGGATRPAKLMRISSSVIST